MEDSWETVGASRQKSQDPRAGAPPARGRGGGAGSAARGGRDRGHKPQPNHARNGHRPPGTHAIPDRNAPPPASPPSTDSNGRRGPQPASNPHLGSTKSASLAAPATNSPAAGQSAVPPATPAAAAPALPSSEAPLPAPSPVSPADSDAVAAASSDSATDPARATLPPATSQSPAPPVAKSWAALASAGSAAPAVMPHLRTMGGGARPAPAPAIGILVVPTATKPLHRPGTDHLLPLVSLARMSLPPISASYLLRGLSNPGNICFMNSTVQSLLACPPLRQLLRALSQHAWPPAPLETVRAIPTLDAFRSLVADMIELPTPEPASALRVGTPFTADYLYPLVSLFSGRDRSSLITASTSLASGIRGGAWGRAVAVQQEDAEEFLRFIVDSLHEESAALEAALGGGSSDTDATRAASDDSGPSADDDWQQVGRGARPCTVAGIVRAADSVVGRLFYSVVRSVVRRPGAQPSASIQPYTVLTLPIASPAVNSVDSALALFVRREVIDGYADSAQSTVAASKQMSFDSLPAVLVVQLARFGFLDADDGAGGAHKLAKHITFSASEPLVFAPALMSTSAPASAAQRSFVLYAVIVHHGTTLRGGHYTAFVRRVCARGEVVWLWVDDASVRVVPAAHVEAQQAYLLLYSRRDTLE